MKNEFIKRNLFDKYYSEIEYIFIEYLLHAANLRFIAFDEGIKNIKRVSEMIHKIFPKWRKNIYYKHTTIRYKIACNLFYYNKIWLLKKIFRRKSL